MLNTLDNGNYLLDYKFASFALRIKYSDNYIHSAQFVNIQQLEQYNLIPQNPLAQQIIQQLDEYRHNPNYQFNFPLYYHGSHHCLKVWEIIKQIPTGKVLSYGQIAQLINSSPRAVGQACGANPLPIFIPCHRVVAKGQALGGFNLSTTEFYLGIKRNLLIHENCY
jgi:methylated-DNA-[protein]-cysteine S-methyltransferase